MIDFGTKKTIDFCMAAAFFLFVSISMGTKYSGVGFPKEGGLSYTTGILGLEDNVRTTKHLTLDNVKDGLGYQTFSCGYSFFDNGRSSGCGDNFYDPYLNKEATIGWYIQDKFLIFKNDMPQMVTLEVDNKVVVSYADTRKKIDDKNKIYKFWFLLSFPLAVLMYFLFRKMGDK